MSLIVGMSGEEIHGARWETDGGGMADGKRGRRIITSLDTGEAGHLSYASMQFDLTRSPRAKTKELSRCLEAAPAS